MRGLKAIAAVLLLTSGAAHAQLSGTATFVTDYSFRAISLTSLDPALQGSIDWAHDSGFYAGAWASNIDYGPGVDGDIELDLYLGITGDAEGGFGWDAGLVYYTYLEADEPNAYPEAYFGLTYAMFELKQWYTNDYVGANLDSYYTEANASFELPAALGLNLHAGYNYGDAFKTDGNSEYIDYSVGVAYTVGNFNLELKYVDTDLDDNDSFFVTDDLFNTEGRVIFSVSTTFPWSAE